MQPRFQESSHLPLQARREALLLPPRYSSAPHSTKFVHLLAYEGVEGKVIFCMGVLYTVLLLFQIPYFFLLSNSAPD